ncbi:MAG: MYXO-CTERM sorting domain-containing protein [Polyangiaceae bacterium]
MKTTRALVALGSAGLALAGVGLSTAHANGRFPDAQQLVVAKDDETHIAVETTYGLIQTRDAGGKWTWACEDAVGYGGMLDPPIALVDSGALVVGVFGGLSISSPDGCSYAFVGGDLTDRYFVDVSAMKGDPSHAIAMSSDGLGSSMFDTQVWKSTDSAVTWSKLGVALPSDFLGLTLDAAPTDEDLLYLSGFQITGNDYVGMLAVSTDAGANWQLKPIMGSANDSGPYIAAIDPVDPQTVYVRLASLAGKLVVTHDGGDTWSTVFEAQGSLLGFALSPDGSKIVVGGPDDGLHKASTSDYAFTKLSELHVRCLTWTPSALYACGREAFDDFTVGKSLDEGATFEPIHHVSCLVGPDPSCEAASTVSEVCPGPWAAQKELLQTDTCNATGGAGGTGAGGTGGTGNGGASDDDGCSCSTPRSGDGTSAAWLLLVAGAALAVSRAARRNPERANDRA